MLVDVSRCTLVFHYSSGTADADKCDNTQQILSYVRSTGETSIITGCTISVIFFTLAMSMLVKSAEVQCRGPLTKSGVRQPPIRAFMDDLTVMTTFVPGSRWILKGLEEMITWARMSFKPMKSRSLVLKKGKTASS